MAHYYAFASYPPTLAESIYYIVEKEALACVWGAGKRSNFLWGTRFTLHHQDLTTLLATKVLELTGIHVQWSDRHLCTNSVMFCALMHKLLLLPVPSEENSELA